MRTAAFNLFLLLIVAVNIVHAAKLNFPRVLLPIFQDKSVNFTLEVVEHNCFKWTSSRQDLITVAPVYHGFSECAYQALITVQTREQRRNTAIIFAEEVSTGATLRCDVIVDVIDKLNVRTTTRQLYLEEAPETYELHAFDSQGNEFSTLEGVEFKWTISSPTRSVPPALRFLTFSDSPFHTVPKPLEKFEAEGIMGYMTLLEGINTGTSKVTVTMPQPEYNNVAPIEVYISVLANIIIEPSEVHIMTGDTVSFRILQLKMGKLHDITPNDQYYFEVEDINVAYIKGSSATGSRLGRTLVVLRDRNVPRDDSDNLPEKPKGPSAQLTVAEPQKLGISLLPHNNWLTVKGERHDVAFDLYASDGQKITLGTRYSIGSELDESLFTILKKTRNGSRLFGEAYKAGVTQVYGTYKDLSAQAELQIFDKLVLQPMKVILPYDPNTVKPQRLQFVSTGGDGNYVWFSGNPQVLQIDSKGLATTEIRDDRVKGAAKELLDSGSLLSSHTTVKVALAKNQKVAQMAQIYFLPPERLEIKQYNFETVLRDYVHLHVGIYAYVNNSYVPYTKCDNLLYQLDYAHQIFQLENNVEGEKLAPDACHVLRLRATAVGTTSLRISYTFQDKVLQDSVDLHVFEPLSVLNPLENEIVLPIGASRNVIYADGPQRIFTLEATLTKATKYNAQFIKVSEIEFDTQNSITAFTVLCREVGSTDFTYNVHNMLTKSNFAAYNAQITTKVHCVRPRFLKLYARQELRKSCPLEQRSSLLYLKDREDKFEIEIEVQDVKNRKLMNISSLVLEWEFAAGDERYHTDSIPHQQHTEEENYQTVRLPARDILVITLNEVAPNFRIKGTVARYDDKALAKNEIYPERPPFGVKNHKTGVITKPVIENEIRFHTVNSTLLPNDHVSIYLAPSYREGISIAQGSGFFQLELSESGIVQVDYDEKTKQLLLTPLRLGHVRLELIDRCLMNEPAHLSISVVGIGAINVLALDRVERTHSIDAIVKLYDSNDNLLHIDVSKLDVYELSELVFDSNILSVRLDEQQNLGPGEIRYSITGNNVGDTKIVFQAGKGDKQVSSDPLNVQVFAPIRLYPRNSTLIVGSSIQIYYQGGPQPNTNMIYSVHHNKVATMNSAIVTAHKLGSTKITGKCLLKNPVTGKDEIVSEDTVELRVVSLTAVEIRTPLVRIRSGAVMPATLWGQPDLSPMVLGTLENMHITWSANQNDVVEIFNVLTTAGIDYKSNDMISIRVRALNPGKVSITAVARLADGQKLSSTVDLIVFKTLELVAPKPITMDWILTAPRSTLQLKCNMDDALYKLDSQSSGIVSVTPDGIVHTKDTLGRDLIIAKTVDQTLPIGIEVKNVQYILVTLLPNIKLKHLEHKIPRGMNFVFKVSLHDNLGNEFSHNIEEVNGLRYDLATKDVVDVQIGNNLTIALNMPRETNNMIAISLKDITGVKHAEDYIKLSVAESEHIFPTKTIFSVGDIICFDSPLTLSSIWTSSNEQIVAINKNTGIARVLKHRHKLGEKIVVTSGDKVGLGGYLKYDLEVRESDAILFAKTLDIFSGSEYRAHLVLRNHIQTDKHTNLIAQNVSRCINHLDNVHVDAFTCRLVANDALGRKLLSLYKVKAIFDGLNSQYACELQLLSNFNELLSIVKTNNVLLEIQALIPTGVFDTMSLKLVPGIQVSPEALQMGDLKSQDLLISGLDKVLQKLQVIPSDTKYLSVEFIEHAHGQGKYKIHFADDFPLDVQLYVLVKSPETDQNIEVPVYGNTMLAQKCSSRPYSSTLFYRLIENLGFIITTVIIIVFSFWVYITCFQTQGVITLNSEAFQSDKSNISSQRSSPMSSPRSPFIASPNRSPFAEPQQRSQSRHMQHNLSPPVVSDESFIYGHPHLGSPRSARRGYN
ncbi:nuclear pore membrane glycoprotein 210 [Scaptodrosophila lebanonensis]|uniref:Nuclear pore membrane glycoprotein 210 n=1 Tax=Drosophila lebanonensis TaxID=7225 RepID=A0A6J2SWQ9_DROLE|nr:nuclear pore membrane glycoprotein 210 [Scaptodrosophila lebanonensis]